MVVVLTKRGAVAFSLCVRGPPSWNATEVGEDGGAHPTERKLRPRGRERETGGKEGGGIDNLQRFWP